MVAADAIRQVRRYEQGRGVPAGLSGEIEARAGLVKTVGRCRGKSIPHPFRARAAAAATVDRIASRQPAERWEIRRRLRRGGTSALAVIAAPQNAMWDAADTVRFAVGMFEVTPNAPSVVPGRVHFFDRPRT